VPPNDASFRIGTLEHFEQKWEWTFALAGFAPARFALAHGSSGV